MSKKKHVKAKAVRYSRMSKGFQQNAMRTQMKESGIKLPSKAEQQKKIRRVKTAGIVWAVLLIPAAVLFRLPGVIVMLAVAVAAASWLLIHLNRQEKDLIKAYKTAGLTKEQYLKEAKRRNPNPKRLRQLLQLWDKVPDPQQG